MPTNDDDVLVVHLQQQLTEEMETSRILNEELEAAKRAMQRALEQLEKYDYKGPKQVSRAQITLEDALREEPRNDSETQ